MIDWPRIIRDLRKAGWHDERTAEALDVTRNYIWQLANGHVREPKCSLGISILALHARVAREHLWHALGPEGQQAVRNIAQAFGPLDSSRSAGRIGDEQVLGEDWRNGLLVMQPDGSLRATR